MLDKSEPNYSEKVDIIELHEIYTYVKKTVQSGSVWTAYIVTQIAVTTLLLLR